MIKIRSYGSNLPMAFAYTDEDIWSHDDDGNKFSIITITPQQLPSLLGDRNTQATMYLFRRHTTPTTSEWVIVPDDLETCLYQALRYHQDESSYEEDVLVHSIRHHSLGIDPDQISIATLLKSPVMIIIELYTMYRSARDSVGNTESLAIQDAYGVWKSFHQQDSKMAKDLVAAYPELVPVFESNLCETDALLSYTDDDPLRAMDDLIALKRSCLECLVDR